MLFFISWVKHMLYTHAQSVCGGQRTAFENRFSPSTMYFLVLEHGLSGLAQALLLTEPSH